MMLIHAFSSQRLVVGYGTDPRAEKCAPIRDAGGLGVAAHPMSRR